MLRKEPLPVPGKSNLDEAKLSLALADVQPALLEVFRGPSAEIRHRLDHYLEALRKAPPVLDLGCGRGELLLLLREAGVEAAGIEGDAAVADAARRRGLDVLEGDVLSVLETLPDASRSAVTAIHLFEHLEAVILIAVLAEVRRVLRPGGLLIVESPNPHSLRVGASLYWVDPTHRRPLMPETLELYLKTGGFEVDRRELLHPFPADQLFTDNADEVVLVEDEALAALAARIDRLHRRLDELVNGPRDFVVWARRPERDSS
jgi:SAM-dependent methyltransferase